MISENYKIWKSIPDDRRCFICEALNGKIYEIKGPFAPCPPMHFFCRCSIAAMEAKLAGTATTKGLDGADWWLKHLKRHPEYYITAEEEAEALGYKRKDGNLDIVAPGKMYTRGIYKNRDERLPTAAGRVWYEADLNYSQGFRGESRILFSNDGLIFVTYDHYQSFVEIV